MHLPAWAGVPRCLRVRALTSVQAYVRNCVGIGGRWCQCVAPRCFIVGVCTRLSVLGLQVCKMLLMASECLQESCHCESRCRGVTQSKTNRWATKDGDHSVCSACCISGLGASLDTLPFFWVYQQPAPSCALFAHLNLACSLARLRFLLWKLPGWVPGQSQRLAELVCCLFWPRDWCLFLCPPPLSFFLLTTGRICKVGCRRRLQCR